MFVIFIFILSILGAFGSETVTIKDLAKKVEKDDLLHDLLEQQLDREGRKLEKHRLLLKQLESDLLMNIKTGMVEEESCIRNGITVLRTINYSYYWVVEQLENMKGSVIRLTMLDDLQRIRYLNTLFANTALSIEECRLKKTKANFGKKELIKDLVDTRIESIKNSIKIPEAAKAARAPFR